MKILKKILQRQKLFSIYLTLIFIIAAPNKQILGATKTWNGSVSTSWTNASNWTGGIPGTGDIGNIPGDLINYPIISTSISVAGITVNSAGSGATLTITTGATILSSVKILIMNTGKLIQTGGTIYLNNTGTGTPTDDLDVEAGGLLEQSGGIFVINNLNQLDGTYTQTGGLLQIYRDYRKGANGLFNSTNGTIELFPRTGGNSFNAPGPGLNQFFNMKFSGGIREITDAGSINVAGDFTNTGGITLTAALGIVFNGTGVQTFISGGAISGGSTIGYTVNSGSTLQMADNSTIVSGNSFILSHGATLGIRSAVGITASVGSATGNIQTTTTRTFSDGATYIYNGTINQNTGTGLPTNLTGTLTINNPGNILTLDNARTIANGGNIQIVDGIFAAGTNLTLASTSTITRSGGSMTGTIQGAGSYNVIYTGNTMTSTDELTGSELNNITLNLYADQSLNLNAARTIKGALILSNGIFNTTSINLLSIADNGSTSGASNSSYINGPLNKIGNDSFTFPVGKAGVYSPIAISAPSSVTDAFTGEYFRTNPNTLGSSITASGLFRISGCEYWSLARTAGTSNVDITLSWSAASLCNSNPFITDLETLTISHFNGSSWNLHGNNGGYTGTTSNGTITWNNVSSFSPFTLGSTSILTNPLPVKFGEFKAFEKQAGVQAEWSTYSENNVDRFEVQRSADGRTFTAIGQVSAKNLNRRSDYSLYDATPLPNNNFYRIKSIDIDGKTDFTSIIKINFNKTSIGFNLYPNPVLDKQISLQAANLEKGEYVLIVSNSSGQQVYRKILSVNAGAISQAIKLPPSLNPGMYSLQLINKATVLSKAFIVQ